MKRKCPYTYPHRSREDKVKYICGIFGYSGHCVRYPIEFRVGTYYADLDFDHLWSIIDGDMAAHLSVEEKEKLRKRAQYLYENRTGFLADTAMENMVESFFDNDAPRTLWDGTQVDVELALEGRGGKHLVITRFDGLDFRGMDEGDLEELLTDQIGGYRNTHAYKLKKGYEWSVPTKTVDLLYKYCRQGEMDFTSLNASKELEYQMAFLLYSMAEDAEDEQ